MTTTTGATRPTGFQREWELALESLELDVAAAEDLLHALHAQSDLPDGDLVMRARWTPPPGTLGPIPRPLVERARTLLQRQHEVAERLAVAARSNRAQVRVANQVAGMASSAPSAAPVYVDVAL